MRMDVVEMVSSVAIDDALRQKLKMLAATYDTTQAEIIRRAISLLEAKDMVTQEQAPAWVKEGLKKATRLVYQKNPERKRIDDALRKPGIDIDDLRIELRE